MLQRDVADPALYVGTWLRDEGLDPRVGEGRAKSDRWLAHLADAGVTGIGFGFVLLRAIDGPSEVVCEELSHPFDDPLGDEVPAHFARMAWLRDADLEAQFPLVDGEDPRFTYGSIYPLEYASAQTELTRARTQYLRTHLPDRSER